jgi:hypothetical protein
MHNGARNPELTVYHPVAALGVQPCSGEIVTPDLLVPVCYVPHLAVVILNCMVC